MNSVCSYERNASGSFMKIEIDKVNPMDEELILESRIPGLIPASKCQLQDHSEYWYEITGKQTLADICGVRQLSCDLLEQLIIQLANAMHYVEDYLIDTNCIMLDPDNIFLSDRQFAFILYPSCSEELSDRFRRLMEYLLTKIDHNNQNLVQKGYGIYEKTLIPGFSITDIRDSILEGRLASAKEPQQETNAHADRPKVMEAAPGDTRKEEVCREDISRDEEMNMMDLLYEDVEEESFLEKIHGWFEGLFRKEKCSEQRSDKVNAGKKASRKKEDDFVISPGQICLPEPEIHPTICLTDYRLHPDGLLLYEGMDGLDNIHLQEGQISIGKGDAVDVEIKKDTISHLHARINGKDQEYYIEDLNSTNGTFINGEALSYREKRMLKTNDIVRFADVKFRFV